MADPFKAVQEEVTLGEVETETVLDIDFTNAFEKVEQENGVVRPEETVVDNLFAVDLLGAFGKAGTEKLVSFFADHTHDGGVHSGGVERAEGHDLEGIFEGVGSKESELFDIGFPNSNLMVTRLGVETDEVEATAGAVAEVVQSVVATRDRVQERESDSVERAVVDAEAPDEFVNIVAVLLVGLRCEKAFAEPSAFGLVNDLVVGEQIGHMLHDDWGLVDAVTSLGACDGKRLAGIDTEAEAEHWAGGAFGVKGVPVAMNDAKEFGAKGVVEVGGHMKVLVKEGLLSRGAGPFDFVGTRWYVITRSGLADGAAMRGGEVEVVVDVVVAEIHGNVFTRRFGAPNLHGHLDVEALDDGRGLISCAWLDLDVGGDGVDGIGTGRA